MITSRKKKKDRNETVFKKQKNLRSESEIYRVRRQREREKMSQVLLSRLCLDDEIY